MGGLDLKFKACAEIKSWDDNLKCKLLGLRVKGTAYEVYQDLEKVVKLDWKELCKTLEKNIYVYTAFHF